MTKTIETTEAKITDVKATEIVRKGALAYVGLYGLAYERAKLRATQLRTVSSDLFETLVARGETLEAQGLELTKDVRTKATELANDTTATVRNVLPIPARTDRVDELETEVQALNKKIAALSKKASTPRKTVKTEKTAKKAA